MNNRGQRGIFPAKPNGETNPSSVTTVGRYHKDTAMKIIRTTLVVVLCLVFLKNVEAFVDSGLKVLSNSKKMSMDGGDLIGSIIEFIMDMMEMASGLIDMAMAMGRKKRSTLEDILMPADLRQKVVP